ncbi:MAG: SgcJ/EcaC family oxidoreductase [Planctomycetaceae bacterium]|nr:SgcJ/EcaC family oxidoreductase [Planctomycetaceae bacterium]
MSRPLYCLTIAAFLISGLCPKWLDEAFGADKEAESARIKARTENFAKALESGDAAKVAALWTDEGEYVRDTMTIRGRKELETAYGKFFEDRPNLKVTVESDNIRFLAPNTAIEEGRFLIKKGKDESGTTGYSILYVKNEGEWSIALLKEQEDRPHLKDLTWILGTWKAEGNGTKVETTYKWDHSKAFLRMEYTSTSDEGTTTGSQMIGLDPLTGLPRSWTFSGNGGFGEGLWVRDGKKWIVRASSRQPDGAEMTATNILTPVDKNNFTWQSTDRKLDGEALPDTDVVKVHRAKSSE